MPGYDQYQKMAREIPGSVKLGSLAVAVEGRRLVVRVREGRQALSLRHRVEAGDGDRRRASGRQAGARARRPGGRAAGARAAVRLRRVARQEAEGVLQGSQPLAERAPTAAIPIALTTDGSEKDRVKYGTASWVYGEELAQRTAMWWSPDSRRIAYYRFDEKRRCPTSTCR